MSTVTRRRPAGHLRARRRMSSTQTLLEILETEYFALNVRIRAEQTRNQYRYSLQNLADFLGRPPTMADLSDDTVIRLTLYLRDVKHLDPRTCNDRRGRINALWTWLSNKGRCSTRPTNAALAVPRKIPRAWKHDELQRLMRACATTPGTAGTLPASTFWLAFHAICWDTAARTTEILSLRWEWLDWSTGWIRVPPDVRKGGVKEAAYRVMSDTLALLATFRKPTGLILGFAKDRSRIWQMYKELLERAGLPATRHDGPQKMRRSHASWLAANHGDATLSLLHDDASTTRKFYLDPTITQHTSPSAQLPFRLLDLRNDPSTQ